MELFKQITGTDPNLGVTGMRERAVYVGGTFSIDSAPGQGTRVRVLMPWLHGPREAIAEVAGRPSANGRAPARVPEAIAKSDGALLFVRRQEDAPTVIEHLDVVVVGPPVVFDRYRGP